MWTQFRSGVSLSAAATGPRELVPGSLWSPPGQLAPVGAVKPSTGLVRPMENMKLKALPVRKPASPSLLLKWLGPASFLISAGLASAALPRTQNQVGEIVSRPQVQSSETALSAIQNA